MTPEQLDAAEYQEANHPPCSECGMILDECTCTHEGSILITDPHPFLDVDIIAAGDAADALHDRERPPFNIRLAARAAAIVSAAAMSLACLILPASAREDHTQGFLTPPSGYTMYLAWEDRSSAAYSESTGQYVVFDPGTPNGSGRGWSMSAHWYTTAR